MNTHDMIELPPLHIPDLEDELTAVLCAAVSWGGSVISSEEYVAAKQRFRAAVNAAIEADRQCRDEPVVWIQRSYLNLIRESNVALHNVVVRGSILDGDGDVVPLFTAPQPAEPVNMHSDAETTARVGAWLSAALCDPAVCQEMKDDIRAWFKVGQPNVQPAEPVKCPDPDMGDHACSDRDQCWEPCGELGKSTEHAKVAEPVKVPRPHEFNTGNEKLDTLLDDTYYLVEDGGMDNAIKWHESLKEFLASIEPVKVPSDAQINEITMRELGKWPSFEAQSWACKVVKSVFARYGQPDPNLEKKND